MAQITPAETPLKTITARLPDDVWHRAKLKCAEKRIPMNEVIIAALRKFGQTGKTA